MGLPRILQFSELHRLFRRHPRQLQRHNHLKVTLLFATREGLAIETSTVFQSQVAFSQHRRGLKKQTT
jgi:hypothetical protein